MYRTYFIFLTMSLTLAETGFGMHADFSAQDIDVQPASSGPQAPRGELSKEDEYKEKAEGKVKALIIAARDSGEGQGIGALNALSEAPRLARELAEMGKENANIVVPLITKRLFHSSEYVRMFLMDALLQMGAASNLAYPYVKELSTVDIEVGPAFRYQRWLSLKEIKPINIPIDVKVSALRFGALNKDAFLRTAQKEQELIKLGKASQKNGDELEKLLKPLLDDDNLEVAKSAKNVLEGIHR